MTAPCLLRRLLLPPALLGAGVFGLFATASTAHAATTTGTWTLDAPHSDSYTSQVQQPINPDGTSVWPAKRGVIPVQFTLTDTQNYLFESLFNSQSIGTPASGAYSALSFTPSPSLTLGQITTLSASYAFTAGDCYGGSLRWAIGLTHTDGSTDTLYVYYGDPGGSNQSCSGSLSESGQNLMDTTQTLDSLNRFEVQSHSNPIYQPLAQLESAGTVSSTDTVNYVSLVLDSGWRGDQVVNLTSATVNDNTYTFPTGSAVRTNAPTAYLVVKYVNGAGTGTIDETLTSAQGDTGGVFRQVDGKYIYNLDVATLKGPGQYTVSMSIGGNVVLTTPGKFALK